jgi:hypothetical protein
MRIKKFSQSRSRINMMRLLHKNIIKQRDMPSSRKWIRNFSLRIRILQPFFLTKYDFKGPKMAFQNIIFKEYLNLVPVYKNDQYYEITPFFDGFC